MHYPAIRAIPSKLSKDVTHGIDPSELGTFPLRVIRDWAGQAAGPANVRNAPLATVGPKKGGLSRWANKRLVHRSN